jgi:hypothetical protein
MDFSLRKRSSLGYSTGGGLIRRISGKKHSSSMLERIVKSERGFRTTVDRALE